MPRPSRPSAAAIAALAVVALSLAVYAGTLSAQFTQWDDGNTIYRNPRLGDLSLDRLRWAFTDVATTMRWVPLTLLSLSLTHTLHGLDPFGYHLANWLIHGASALLLFLLLADLLRRAALRGGTVDPGGPWVPFAAAVGALSWGLHPLRAEVVAWCNSRGHAQATLLVFLSLLLYVRGHRDDAPAHPWRATALAALAFLAALLSHPIAIGAAPVFLLLDVHLGRLGGAAGWWTPGARRVLAEKLPIAAAAAAVLAVTLLVRTFLSGRWEPPVPLSQWGLFPRAMQATFAWIHYALVTLWPVGLQPAPTELIDFDPWSGTFLARAALVVAVTAALVTLRRRLPTALLLWLAWLALLVPALGLTEHPMFACDRYTSLAGLVPAAAVGSAVLWLGASRARRALAGAGAALLLALLGGRSVAQAATWHDSVALFEHMLPLLGDHPFRGFIFANLGTAYLDRKDPAAAVRAYEQAVTVSPYDPEVRSLLAYALWATGRRAEAVAHLEVAVRQAPEIPDLRCQLAAALLQTGRRADAVAAAQGALEVRPGAPCAQRFLAELGIPPAP